MKKLKLQNLNLENFMGIEEFQFNPKRENCKVLGDNGVGKTNLYSSFLFLLFGEDSRRQSQFDIKPVAQSNAETLVMGKFEFEDETFTLTRKYNNSYEYAVNGVPKKKTEFEEFLGGKFDLDKLRILVDPQYFNEGLHWQERRAILMDLVKGVEAEDIIEANSELKKLDLGGLDPEDRRDQLKAEIKELEEEKRDIPVQIKTLQDNAPGFEEELDTIEEFLENLKSGKEESQNLKENLEEGIADLKSSGQQVKLRKRKNEIEAKMGEFEQNWKSIYEDEIEKLKKEQSKVQANLDQTNRDIEDTKYRGKHAKQRIEELTDEIKRLRDSWHKIRDQKFDGEVCPTCGQEIPDDELEKVRKSINKDKAEEITKIQDQGNKKRKDKEKLEGEVEHLGEELGTLQEEQDGFQDEIDRREDEIKQFREQKNKYKDQSGYLKLQDELKDLKQIIEQDEKKPSEELKEKREQLRGAKKEIDEQNQAIAQAKEYRRTLDKVGQLKAKESKLAGKLEGLKNQLRLVNEFVKTKANMLENSINAKFDLVNFELFEHYKSKEGVKEVCKTLVDNVSWSTLNNAGRIKAGLDIIKTLSREWSLEATVWIDGAESITRIPQAGSQQIELVVKEGVKELEALES